jgi:hypothetical protein
MESLWCGTHKGLAEVPATADEGDLELGLVDVVVLVRHRQHLALIDVIHLNASHHHHHHHQSTANRRQLQTQTHLHGLQDLRLDKVADARLRITGRVIPP